MKILLTGFERSDPYPWNPTEKAVAWLDGKKIDSCEIQSIVLPPDLSSLSGKINFGKTLMSHARHHNAEAIISFGTDPNASGFRLETRAINQMRRTSYSLKKENEVRIDARFPKDEERFMPHATWMVERIRQNLKKNNTPFEGVSAVPAIASATQASNALMFLVTQRQIEVGSNLPFYFFHIPFTQELLKNFSGPAASTSPLTERKLMQGIRRIIESFS